jgi:hypothetical protein
MEKRNLPPSEPNSETPEPNEWEDFSETEIPFIPPNIILGEN